MCSSVTSALPGVFEIILHHFHKSSWLCAQPFLFPLGFYWRSEPLKPSWRLAPIPVFRVCGFTMWLFLKGPLEEVGAGGFPARSLYPAWGSRAFQLPCSLCLLSSLPFRPRLPLLWSVPQMNRYRKGTSVLGRRFCVVSVGFLASSCIFLIFPCCISCCPASAVPAYQKDLSTGEFPSSHSFDVLCM